MDNFRVAFGRDVNFILVMTVQVFWHSRTVKKLLTDSKIYLMLQRTTKRLNGVTKHVK